jgi:hypothetical protein
VATKGERALTRAARLLLGFAVLSAGTHAFAQTRLGELLDAGAKPVSAEEFQKEVVQLPLYGPLDSGVNMEMVYTSSGALEGAGAPGRFGYVAETFQVRGTWKIGDKDAVCAALVLEGPTIRANYPPRCRFWFKLDDRYYVSDSASDRRARVLVRSVRR